MKIFDNCGCDRWALDFAKTLFERNNIPCNEAYIEDMDDRWITIRAEVRRGESENGEDAWDEKEFTIKYWVEQKFLFISIVSVWFYVREDVERVNAAGEKYIDDMPVDIEKGAYCIVRFPGFTVCKKIN